MHLKTNFQFDEEQGLGRVRFRPVFPESKIKFGSVRFGLVWFGFHKNGIHQKELNVVWVLIQNVLTKIL